MISYRDTHWSDARTNREFIEALVKIIASTAPEYRNDLCRDFRIPPAMVAAEIARRT